MTVDTIEGVVLDHVAHAVPHWQDVWDRYATDLGAEWSSGGPGPGFAPGQVQFANGARIEILMPHNPEVNDFLVRFLARSGPGPHHLTFKVPNLDTALDRARDAGFEPIGIDRTDPEWMEAFIHPKQATGVVVQMAEAPNPWSSPPPDGYPVARRQRSDGTGPVAAASLVQVVHAVADLDAGTALFAGLLGGTLVAEGGHPDHRWVDLTWGGPLDIRLVAPIPSSARSPLLGWLGARPGRLHHLELVAEEPERVPGAEPGDPARLGLDTDRRPGAYRVIAPEANAGLGLVITAP